MPAIVILAAGRSTRFGASKQTTAVGPAGEWLMEYALADASAAGFDRAAIVVAPGSEPGYVERLRTRPPGLAASVLPQKTGLLPEDVERAPRVAPWGTAHAVLAARAVIGDEPFLVVNADDYYGPAAYRLAAAALGPARDAGDATVVAMRIGDTLPPKGAVTRAVLRVEHDRLIALDETRGLERRGGRIHAGDGTGFDETTLVSMNCWVLPPGVIAPLEDRFARFARSPAAASREFLLPAELWALSAEGRLRIRVVQAPGPWFGLTSGGDLAWVEAGLRAHRPRNSTTAATSSDPNDSDSSL